MEKREDNILECEPLKKLGIVYREKRTLKNKKVVHLPWYTILDTYKKEMLHR